MKLPTRNTQDAHVKVDLLSSYLDNQVTPEQRAYIERHLHTCASCQLELQSLRQTVAMLQALPRVPVPRAFTLSEVQVGRRARAGAATAAPWFGGLARIAGVMAALAVIAVSVAILRQSAFAPAAQVARAPAPAAATGAITEAPAAPQAAAPPAVPAAPSAPTVSAQGSPNAAAQAKQAPAQPPATEARGQVAQESARSAATNPTATPPSGQDSSAPAAVPAPQAPAVANTEAPTASPAPTEEPMMAMSAPSAEAGPSTATAPSAAAAAAAAPRGMGGGNAGSADSRMAAVPPPPTAPIDTTLPDTAALAYADGQSVWALDRAGGTRQLVEQPGATMPVISPDRSRVAFWVMQDVEPELWVVGWDGSSPHRLLAQQDLPRDGAGSPYEAPQFVLHDLSWVPGTHVLAFQTYASPAGGQSEGREVLWNLDGDSGALRQVLDVGMNSALAYSPDGKHIALMQRGTAEQPVGNLTLYGPDGSGKRKVFDLPANPSGAGYDAQLSWLPDSRSLWVGVVNPSPDMPGQISSVTLYRVPYNSSPVKAGQVPAANAYWSPDRKHLIYTRPLSETFENQELVLANADGSNARVYQTLKFGMFAGWAPDSTHFLYQSDGNTFVGAAGQQPQLLSGLPNPMLAHWVAPGQLVYLLDEPGSSVLVWQPLDGPAASLSTLPAGVTLDALQAK